MKGSGRNLLLACAVIGMALALASCGGMQVQVPKEVKMQVPVPCVDAATRPKPPAIVDTDTLLAMDRGTRTLRIDVDRDRLIAYTAELEAVVEGCSRIPVVPGAAEGKPR